MHYELTYIISAAVPETKHPEVQNEIQAYLDKIKVQITKPFYAIGRKKLAYPIKKQKHGFYVAVEFDLDDPTGLKELDTALKHNHNILRFLVIKKKKGLGQESERRLARRIPSDHRRISEKKETPIRKEFATSSQDKITETPVKINLDDLDEKLDKILEE